METKIFENCPHCGTKIKSSVFGTPVTMYTERTIRLINEFVDNTQPGYCSKCGEKLYQNALALAKQEFMTLKEKSSEILKQIPVVTLQHPYNWQYSVVKMVTGQSTLGTGIFTDFVSSFTDMVGGESSRYNEKVKSAENNCLNQLRVQALEAGATAVIGSDIDYSEMGGAKSMVLVCMSGTAVKLNNPEIISSDFAESIKNLNDERNRMKKLQYLITETPQ